VNLLLRNILNAFTLKLIRCINSYL